MMSTYSRNLRAALYYLKLGWSPIPLCWPAPDGTCGCGRNHQGRNVGKAPLLGSGYQNVRPTEDDVNEWWTRWPHANVGILLEPSGLLVVDCDGDDALSEAESLGLPPGPVAETGSGRHYYYRADGTARRATKRGASAAIDVFSLGYVVVPPSQHRSGKEYTWLVTPHNVALGDAPDWVVQLVTKSDPAPAAPELPETTAASLAEAPVRLSERGRLLWRGEMVVDKDAGRLKPVSEVREVDRSETLYALGCELARAGATSISIISALRERDQALYQKYTSRPDAGLDEYRRIANKALNALAANGDDAVADTGAQQKDYGHAAVLARLFLNRYRWAVHRGCWMRYDGRVWRQDVEEHVAKAAADALRQHYVAQLAVASTKEAVTDLSRKVAETCIFTRIKGALAFLRGWENILTLAEQWDSDHWLLNVANGTLDLRTGELRPHDPTDLCTKLAPVDYDPAAAGPHWEAHVSRFLPNDNVRRQVQRDLGRALVGVTLEESLPLWHGTGANGKTTTARVLLKVLGDYADRAAPNLLIKSRHERHPTEIAELAGLRLVFSIEVDQGKQLAEALVKELTGGDRKKGRFMRQDFFGFEQTFSIVLIVNHKPIVSGSDDGIWRRIRLVPWEISIPESERRPQEEVVNELVAEGPAILAWLLDGLRDWQRDHHWVAPEVRAASDAYRAEMDVLGDFVAERCILGNRYEVAKGELYQAYVTWCEGNRERPLSKKAFSATLRERGIAERRGAQGVRLYVGIGLLTQQVADGGATLVSTHETATSERAEKTPPSGDTSAAASSSGAPTAGDGDVERILEGIRALGGAASFRALSLRLGQHHEHTRTLCERMVAQGLLRRHYKPETYVLADSTKP